MYDEVDWRSYDAEWQTAMVKRTDPINLNKAEPLIKKVYKLLGFPEPQHFILVRNPLEMFSLQLYLDGLVEPYDNLNDIYRWNKSQIDDIEKLSTPLTAELVEYALAYSFLKDKVVKNPLGRWIGKEPTMSEVIDFENEQKSGIKLNSLEDDIFNFVKRVEDNSENILKEGGYKLSRHKVEVPGWPKIKNAEQFTNLSFSGGNWAVWTPKFRYLQDRFGYSHTLMNLVCDISENTHYWMAYKNHVVLCDRPQEVHTNGPNGALHNPNGPAIKYDGFELYYHGDRHIPDWFIKSPINKSVITKEQDQELRRILFTLYGVENWLRESQAEEIHRETIKGLPYILYETRDEQNEILHILHCIDGSEKLQPDGSWRQQEYYLLTPREQRTCLASVAATYNVSPEQYLKMLVRT